ncbi:cell growth-regulating nucleolar protein-like [Anneissia japonica]|uniref:cell growth-regulating nucleolar protein-like n=1 Tax=Anneissia japonica TaxID=1529436 RepID=UPI001425A84B|nr:cell growth-regulating nucleolar protein-like [Anneissia japonica]
MVFFICNACGQSVKKAQVEKHYMQQCRQCEVLSCMDCGQDFVGDGYKEHTKCISENEKYGSKKEVSNLKPNKGEVKQAAWLERVREASTSQKTNPKMRNLLNQIIEYPNIPRKKTKFENFLKNSLKLYDNYLIQQAWVIVSGSNEKNEEASKQNGDKNENHQKNTPESNADENTNKEENKSESNGIVGRKRKISDQVTESETKRKQVCSEESSVDTNNQIPEKFKWNNMIKRILREKESKEMSIKKLRKKVIAEYNIRKGESKTEEELNEKFYRKLNSNPSLMIDDKRVKLII